MTFYYATVVFKNSSAQRLFSDKLFSISDITAVVLYKVLWPILNLNYDCLNTDCYDFSNILILNE